MADREASGDGAGGVIPDEWLNNIVTGDARELAKCIPSKSIPVVFSSPPFKDEDVDGSYWMWYDQWFTEMQRVCSCVMVVIHSATRINDLIRQYPPKRLMIWGKGISQYSYRFNPILVYQMSDEYSVNLRIWTDAIGVQSVTNANKSHKYEDPEELYRVILQMFDDAGMVLDPCSGSGTTAAVCKSLGIPFIGFEIDAATAERARQRVAATQPPLFVVQHKQMVLA